MLENIKPEWTLESGVTQAALRYCGHVVREERGLENDVMLGGMSEKRRQGRPKTRWLHIKTKKNLLSPSERERESNMEKCYRGCLQKSDTTQRHKLRSIVRASL